MRLTTLVLVVLAWLTPSLGAEEAVSTQRLTLLHTSDLHGAVLPVDDVTNRPARGSLAQVATLVAAVRSEVDQPVLVLDSGDAIQGTPFELFAHVRWGEPSPTIGAMNRVGYAAMAVGNHEFNFGLEVLRRGERQATFPMLSATVIDRATGEPAFPPFVVLEAGAVRVGVLGLTTPAIPGWEMPEHYRGLDFLTPETALARWLPVLRTRCDLVVVLAHTGFERDVETGEPAAGADPFEDSAWRLAHTPGVDLLLTGHTHRSIPPRRLGEAIVAQPGSRARFVTRVDLELERGPEGWRIARFEGANLPTADLPADAGVTAPLADLHARLTRALDTPVGSVSAPLSVAGCRVADCAALDLIHAAQLEASGAEASLAATLSPRTPDLPAGPVTWRWVHGLYVYPNSLVAVRLTGAQVRDLLEHAARYHDGLDCSGEGVGCTLLTDPAIPLYDVDSMAGVSYRVDPTRPEGERVRDLTREGLPLADDEVLTVVVNNYRAAGGGGYPHLAEAEVIWRDPCQMTEVLGEFLTRHDPYPAVADGNWRLAPDVVTERPTGTPPSVD